MDFQKILNHFLPSKILVEIKPFGNGHINSTYKVTFKNNEQEYILQKINISVFTKPNELIQNHIKIQDHLKKLISDIEIPQLNPTTENQFLYKDENGGVWRLTNFIKDSYSIDVLENNNQAFEAGRGYGWFANSCSELNPLEFKEVIKDFHKLSFRVDQLNEAIKLDKANRYNSVKSIVDFYKHREKS